MRRKQRPAHHLARPLVQQIADQHHIAQRLGHLFGFDVQEAVMHPVARQRRSAVRAGALRQLVLMVGEDQVRAAAMNIDRLAQIGLDHGGAFQMPARAAIAPLAGPGRLALLRRLPQHEIGRVALIGRNLHPRAGHHGVAVAAGQFAVCLILVDVEQHVLLRLIGEPALFELADHADHFRHMAGRGRLHGRVDHVQGAHVPPVDIGIDLRDLRAALPGLLRRRDDLVVHVGDVPGIDDMVRAIDAPQQAEQRVENHRRAGIADMGVVIDGRAADIERHPLRVGRFEVALFPRQRVVKFQSHGPTIR